MVDAADSKSAVRKDVLVRFQSRALVNQTVKKVAIRRPFLFARNFCKLRISLLQWHTSILEFDIFIAIEVC